MFFNETTYDPEITLYHLLIDEYIHDLLEKTKEKNSVFLASTFQFDYKIYKKNGMDESKLTKKLNLNNTDIKNYVNECKSREYKLNFDPNKMKLNDILLMNKEREQIKGTEVWKKITTDIDTSLYNAIINKYTREIGILATNYNDIKQEYSDKDSSYVDHTLSEIAEQLEFPRRQVKLYKRKLQNQPHTGGRRRKSRRTRKSKKAKNPRKSKKPRKSKRRSRR